MVSEQRRSARWGKLRVAAAAVAEKYQIYELYNFMPSLSFWAKKKYLFSSRQ
jgi:hypothetical protein